MAPANLVGVKEIAQRAGVTRDGVHKWRSRYETFPAPVAELAQGPVWDWLEVSRWLDSRKDGGQPKQ